MPGCEHAESSGQTELSGSGTLLVLALNSVSVSGDQCSGASGRPAGLSGSAVRSAAGTRGALLTARERPHE